MAVLASVFHELRRLRVRPDVRGRLGPAVWVGAVVVGMGALAALFIPRKRRPSEVGAVEPSAGELVPATVSEAA